MQGYLESSSGEPKDGPTKLRFRLYDRAEPTGNPMEILYEETQMLSLSKGYFTTYLGDAGQLSVDVFRTHAIVFVGILVGDEADEVKPLLQLGTAPYAGFANACGDANTLGGKTAQEIVAAAKTGPTPLGGSAGAGGTGPAGPKGDPGVLSVVASGPVTATLQNQTLTINSHAPFVGNQAQETSIAASGASDFGWLDTPVPPGLTCQVTVMAWLNGTVSDVASPNTLKIASKGADGVVVRDYPVSTQTFFRSNQIANLTAAFQARPDPVTYGCSVTSGVGSGAASCRVTVFCF